jgi:UDP-N-acetylglucosamine 1-carboxyvinyltransferase
MTLLAAPAKTVVQPRLEITGGQRLSGEIKVNGAKNSALVLMAACLLTRETLRLRNVPRLTDIAAMGEILAALGVQVVLALGNWTAAWRCVRSILDLPNLS